VTQSRWSEIHEQERARRAAEAERLRQVVQQPVDAFTVGWIQRQMAEFHQRQIGLESLLARAVSDLEAAHGRLNTLQEINSELVSKLGELTARMVTTEDRVEKMAAWATKVRSRLEGGQRDDATGV